ncbi:MAG: DNA-processing protein DprA, partial [Candidatus Zixiibacteriota bacterium]
MNWEDSQKIDELVSYLAALSVPGLGPRSLTKLIRAFGSAREAVRRDITEMVERAGLSRSVASTLAGSVDLERARKSAEQIRGYGWGVALDTDPEYPGILLEISDRPPILFYLGEFSEDDLNAIAVVGSRRSSEEGRSFAHGVGASLARSGITVISGMARGIDSAAHMGALSADGRTIAVLGCALDYKFSPLDRQKVERISASGMVISEFPPGTPTLPENFPRRNRIISGLSQGVVVIEAGPKSGALLTASNALDQNRELFAAP